MSEAESNNQVQQSFDLGDYNEESDFHRTYQTEIYSRRETDDSQIAKGFTSADLIPFFVSDKRKLSIVGKATAAETTMSRLILVDNSSAKLVQKAANITSKIGSHKNKQIFRHLGEREEAVLDALKYIASYSPGCLGEYQGSAALRFSLYQVGQVLCKAYNSNEISEALDVLNQSPTELTFISGNKKQKPIKSALLPVLITSEDPGHEDLFENDTATLFCTFHPLITKDIVSLNTRQLNSSRIRNRRSSLAKHIEKRLSHVYTQASENTPYGKIKASSLLLNAGLPYDETKSPSLNFRPLFRALSELVLPDGMDEESEDGKDYLIASVVREDINKPSATGKKLKVVDYYYTFYPTDHFVKQQIAANVAANRDRERLALARELGVHPAEVSNIRLEFQHETIQQ